MPEARGGGQEKLTHTQGQGLRPGGATPCLRPGAAARKTNPTPEARGGDWEELPHAPTPEARGGSWEDQPHV